MEVIQPPRVNILIWVIIFGSLNSADILQKKAPNKCLLPSVCPLCLKAKRLHPIFSSFSWMRFFSTFNIVWFFDGFLCSSILQLLEGPLLPKKPRLLWSDLLKAILSELWFERN